MDENIEKAKNLFLEGLSFYQKKQYLEAEIKFKLSIEYLPDRISTLLNLAATQINLLKFNDALDNLFKILKKEPDNYLVLMNISNIYADNRNFEQALSFINKALEKNEKNSDLISNKAGILRFIGEIESALDLYNVSLELNQHSHSIKFNKAICELSLQNFEGGWLDYEYRDFDEKSLKTNLDILSLDKKILIRSEQGLGDVIMFSILLAFFKKHQNITMELDNRLLDIYRYSFPKIKFISNDEFKRFNYDDHLKIKIGSLAKYFIKDIKDIKKINYPFLKIPPKPDLETNTINKDKINIGIYWSSHSYQKGKIKKLNLLDLIKSIDLKNINLISLQDGEYREEIIQVEKDMRLQINSNHNFDLKNDINSLARLISNCDLIISISTTIVHLAGALGVPTIILTQFSPDWRFFQFDDDYIWYKNTQILKQQKLDDWTEPLKKLNGKIKKITNKF